MIRRNLTALGSAALVLAALALVPGCAEVDGDDADSSSSAQTGVAGIGEVQPPVEGLSLKEAGLVSEVAAARADEALNAIADATYLFRLNNFQQIVSGATPAITYALSAGAALTAVPVAGLVVVGVAVIVVGGVAAYYLVATEETNANQWWAQPAVQTRDAIARAVAGFQSWYGGYEATDTRTDGSLIDEMPFANLVNMGTTSTEASYLTFRSKELVNEGLEVDSATFAHTVTLNNRAKQSKCTQQKHDRINDLKKRWCKSEGTSNKTGMSLFYDSAKGRAAGLSSKPTLHEMYALATKQAVDGVARADRFWPALCDWTMSEQEIYDRAFDFDTCSQLRGYEQACLGGSDRAHIFVKWMMNTAKWACENIFRVKFGRELVVSPGDAALRPFAGEPIYCSAPQGSVSPGGYATTSAVWGDQIVYNGRAYVCANPTGGNTNPADPSCTIRIGSNPNESCQWTELGPNVQWSALQSTTLPTPPCTDEYCPNKVYLPVVTK